MKVLPNFFKTRNYSSFVRQLNLYNFHKVKNADGFIEFAHDRFRRGQLDSLQFIVRKVGHENEALRQRLKAPKPMSFEYNRLLGIIRDLENSLQAESRKSEQKSKEHSDLVREMERRQLQNSKRHGARHTRSIEAYRRTPGARRRSCRGC